MKKLLRRFLRITLLSFTVIILTIAVVILFPQRLFAYKLIHKEFTVCSNNKIDPGITLILDNAMDLVKKSELHDPLYKYNIILCHNTFYNKIDNKLLGFGPAARGRPHNVIVKVRIDVQTNRAFPTFPDSCELNLTELVAHEMIHCLQINKYGILKFNPFKHPELWKLDGYPEYISKQAQRLAKDYSLQVEIDRYLAFKAKASGIWILSEEGGCKTLDYYLKGRLLTEYLIDIKGFSYHEILNDTTSEGIVYTEMIRWKDSTVKK